MRWFKLDCCGQRCLGAEQFIARSPKWPAETIACFSR
jgi:hypothetical protein